MTKYKLQAEMVEGNPEFAPEGELTTGYECDGFLVIAVRNGDVRMESSFGMNIMQIAEYLANENTKMTLVLKQAMAIAEGLEKAYAINEKKKRSALDDLMDVFAKGAKD